MLSLSFISRCSENCQSWQVFRFFDHRKDQCRIRVLRLNNKVPGLSGGPFDLLKGTVELFVEKISRNYTCTKNKIHAHDRCEKKFTFAQ